MQELLIIVVLVGVAAVAAYVISRSRREAGDEAPVEPRRRADRVPEELRIEHVGPGGVLALRHFGEGMADIDVRILARHLYSEDGWEWFELEGESELGKVWLTVEEDDETEVSASLRRLTLAELGVTADQLEAFDNDEAGEVVFEGMTYTYTESGEAIFFKDGDRLRPHRFYYWEFAGSDGVSLISVERWGSREVEVHVSKRIEPHQITVYANTGEQ